MNEYYRDQQTRDTTVSLKPILKKEDFELSLTDIFFVKSAGNYVEVWYRNKRAIR